MNEGQYYVGKYRVDFGILISPETVARLEETMKANGINMPEGCTMYDLLRGFHGSYCDWGLPVNSMLPKNPAICPRTQKIARHFTPRPNLPARPLSKRFRFPGRDSPGGHTAPGFA